MWNNWDVVEAGYTFDYPDKLSVSYQAYSIFLS